MRLAYFVHLTDMGLLFSPIFPLLIPVVLMCQLLISICDRYNILNVAITRDVISREPDCLGSVFTHLRVGLLLMLCVTAAYYS